MQQMNYLTVLFYASVNVLYGVENLLHAETEKNSYEMLSKAESSELRVQVTAHT